MENQQQLEYSLIMESFTFDEGGDTSRFKKAVAAAAAIVSEDQSGELLVVDVCGISELQEVLKEYPQIRVIDTVGLGYDSGKMKAVEAASGKYILFLDGDCLPYPGWKQHFLSALRSGRSVAFGGYTRYDGGFYAAVQSVMDFGFFYPCEPRILQCYAFNNCAFVREALLSIPAGGKNVRCSCYHHAQQFLRRSTPVYLVPQARVLHEVQPLIRERTRQGFDVIAACWEDPEVSSARWLRWGVLSLPLYYLMSVYLDWRRVWSGRKALNLSLLQCIAAMPLFPAFRLFDAAGMLQAFVGGKREGGWGGNLLKRRSVTSSGGK